MPKVSVIIPTYNSVRFLSDTIDSVLNQTFDDIEIIVVDDGSTDNTSELMARYVSRFPDKIKYIKQRNQGPAIARNTGASYGNAEYIAFLDSDDLWLKEKLETQLAFFEKYPEYSFSYSDVYAMDEDGNIGKTMMRLKHPVSGEFFYNLLKENFISLPTSMIRRKCFDKVGGFSADPQIISTEDHHLWLKMARYYKGGYIDKPLAKYRIHSGSLSSQCICQRKRELLVIDKIAQEFPDMYATGLKHFRDAKSRLNFEIGFICYRNNEFDKARDYFGKSLKENIFYFRSLKLILITAIFPASLYLKYRNETIDKDETGLLNKKNRQ
ncbi:MAG: glycosyltransferase [Candidatus Auribacterota bacterium]|jgi:glycosyltransferase involved in cell wall biosynthesis|nr:glycosyltransferase [Candidatus Auribacterota bacterium]